MAEPVYGYPTDAELTAIGQDLLPALIADRAIFEIMPMRNDDMHFRVMWEQEDDWLGMMQFRGLGGAPPTVQKTGAKRFIVNPGVYGEKEMLDEAELTERRPLGTFSGVIPVDDLVAKAQEKLVMRRLNLIEKIGWDILQGSYSIPTLEGGVAVTDTFDVQTYDASNWSVPTTATILGDMRAVQLKSRGFAVSFGPGAIAYMNQVTFNKAISNSNAADLYGRRTQGLGTINNVKALNDVFVGENLPTFRVYDGGYKDDDGDFQLWIPDDVVIVVGRRAQNRPVAEFIMTRNDQNNGRGGPYQKVIDTLQREVPRHIEVHDGLNGAPAIYYPSSVVVMDVGA